MRAALALALAVLAVAAFAPPALAAEASPVGDRRLPSGQVIEPVGDVLAFPGRPVDCRLSADGATLFIKEKGRLRIVNTATFELLQTLDCPGGTSLIGVAIDSRARVYATNAGRSLHVFEPNEGKPYRLARSIELPADSFPCGVTLSPDERLAYVCLSKSNQLAKVDLDAGLVAATVDVGVAPFDVAMGPHGKRLYVSNIGGRRPMEGDLTATSAGAETVVDSRGIASTGTVSVVDSDRLQVVQTIESGLHPSSLVIAGESLYVANSNDDTLTRIMLDGGKASSIVVKPDAALPFGSMPAAVAHEPMSGRLMVALAGNNCVAVIAEDVAESPAPIEGLVPTAWYPTAIAVGRTHAFVACAKGTGSRSEMRPREKGYNSHDHEGVVQRIALSDLQDSETLSEWTRVARAAVQPARVREAMRAQAAGDTKPQPVPERLGEPSCFQHILYVIKENRTFDQVFGDIEGARGEPSLCVFPERLSPNHHALAKRFGVLDNYYCNGVLSADGHSWATEGNVTPYLERAFGGFARSYTFGDDPITYSSSGFVWDHVLAAGLSFRNYGELDYAEPPAGVDYFKLLQTRKQPGRLEFVQNIGIDRLRRYSCRDYPGWNMGIPDAVRMDRFLSEFERFQENGGLPNLSIVYLPQDHFGGPVTSRAHMADNDLAIGRLVEAVSRSRYWKNTLIVINEDDPQNGYDHIDGHRSICLVVSAHSRGGVNHDFFNQTSVLRTILHILGLPPMNQQEAAASLMASCFHDQYDETPYAAITPATPLDERPAPREQQSSVERRWRDLAASAPTKRTGMKTPRDEDNLNRFVWHEVMGWEKPYPAEWSGPHGRGLGRLGLQHTSAPNDD